MFAREMGHLDSSAGGAEFFCSSEDRLTLVQQAPVLHSVSADFALDSLADSWAQQPAMIRARPRQQKRLGRMRNLR